MSIKGWKCFNKNLECRDFKYEIGKTYTHDGKIELCESGFHFHKSENDLFKYYVFDSSQTAVCEIEALGNIIDGDDKSVTDEIKIIKLLSWDEVKKLVLKNGNSGLWNSGNRNSGNSNSGDYNSGNSNSGDYNSGNSNSGNSNSGHYNSGHYNSGHWNSGDYNSGHWNSGDYNSGHWNSGDYNSGDYNSGFFNTNEPTVRMFNKDTGLTRDEIKLPSILSNLRVTEWIKWEDMNEKERKEINCFASGGYTKKIPYKDAWEKLWSNATDDEKESIKQLPNFDSDIFFEITGIRV